MPSAKSVQESRMLQVRVGLALIKEEACGHRFSVRMPQAKTKRKAPADPVAVDSKHYTL